MFHHFVGALETERLGCRGGGHALFLDDRPIVPSPQELVINQELPAISRVSLGIIKNGKLHTFL